MKVLYVAPVAERGGMEVILLNLVRELDRSRVTPLVAFLQSGPFAPEIEKVGVEVHTVEAGRVRDVWRGAKAVGELARLIRRRHVALVHTLNAKAHLYGGVAAALAGVPCLYHLHGVPTPGPSRDGVVSILSVLIPAGRTVACSAYVARAFGRTWRSGRHVTVVHNGVALEPGATRRTGSEVREELGAPDNAPLVVMACRLQRGKGVHVFVDAVAQVRRTCPEARFAVVGGALFGLEAAYPQELHEQAERLGLSGALSFTGYRTDAHRLLAAADIVVHASIEPDSLPTVILEAMALGKPVVASDLGGPSEMIEDGVTGILVPPDSHEQLAEGILALLRAPDRRAEMGKAGAVRAHKEFTVERMARRFEDVYAAMTAPATPGSD